MAANRVQAAILRHASVALRGGGLLLRMRTESMEATGFTESLRREYKPAINTREANVLERRMSRRVTCVVDEKAVGRSPLR
jgi:hypothetical protein